MTLDELVFHQEQMAARGASAEEIVAFGRAAREWRIRQRCARAVKKALFPVVVPKMSIAATAPEADTPIVAEAPQEPVGEGGADGRQRMFHRARERLQQAAVLSPNERHVGLALLSHYNHRTGRLFPSMATLGVTSNTSERTARRAVRRLSALGLFAVDAHAGARNTNSYRPRWGALLGLASRAEANAAAAAAEPVKMNNAANLAATAENPGQIDAANPATGGRQTSESNRKKRPVVGQQLELRVFGAVGGTGVRQLASGDPVEAAIRGKYRDHIDQVRMLGAWWALDEGQRSGIADLQGFEAWLRERGPPVRSRAGG